MIVKLALIFTFIILSTGQSFACSKICNQFHIQAKTTSLSKANCHEKTEGRPFNKTNCPLKICDLSKDTDISISIEKTQDNFLANEALLFSKNNIAYTLFEEKDIFLTYRNTPFPKKRRIHLLLKHLLN